MASKHTEDTGRPRAELIVGDMRELRLGEPVPLILTDPPYVAGSLPLLEALAEFADRSLVDGGSLVAMVGQIQIADATRIFSEAGLRYNWTLACLTPGANPRIWPLKMFAGWKALLWYSKGAPRERRTWIEDRLVSRPDKRYHPWGQDLAVFTALVRGFSRIGETVADPFLGAGTTTVAAASIHRRFIGVDLDAEAVRKARVRLDALDEFLGRRSA